MPAYDYTCARCGHLTEVFHGIHASGPTVCPNCGAEGTMRKGITAAAIHFKGSGWAKKDRSASKAGNAKSKPAEGEPAGGGDSSKDGSSKDGSSKDGSSKDGSKDGSTDGGSGPGKPATVTSGSPSSNAGASAGGD